MKFDIALIGTEEDEKENEIKIDPKAVPLGDIPYYLTVTVEEQGEGVKVYISYPGGYGEPVETRIGNAIIAYGKASGRIYEISAKSPKDLLSANEGLPSRLSEDNKKNSGRFLGNIALGSELIKKSVNKTFRRNGPPRGN
jgi:hypothetical protein